MSRIGQKSLEMARRLLQATRGSAASMLEEATPPQRPPLPCFPLYSHHLGSISSSGKEPATPSDFHTHLCHKIATAQRRVHFGSLYIGAGTTTRETELLRALSEVDPNVDLKILLDANRALRPVAQATKTTTSSAKAVYQCLQSTTRRASGLYLFQTLSEPRKRLLPSPLNEVAGVFHMKVYIVDDELILSGANLSEEYFDDRQDRYALFRNGGGGLVDFYAELLRILCEYADPYPLDNTTTLAPFAAPKTEKEKKTRLLQSLSLLMDGSNQSADLVDDHAVSEKEDIVAYAVPTFQAPLGFFTSIQADVPFLSDAEATRQLLLASLEHDPSVNLCSAYLNPTDRMMDTLSHLPRVSLLTAGPSSHGFAPKPGRPRRGDTIVPFVFSALNKEIRERLPHADLLLYERPNWTFHCKGLWIHTICQQQKQQQYLAAAMVGSGNFGARSEVMDVESNCILVFPQTDSTFQRSLEEEWNSLCQFAKSSDEVDANTMSSSLSSWKVRAALPFIRDLF